MMSNGSAYRLSRRHTWSLRCDDADTAAPRRSVGFSLCAGYIGEMTHLASVNCVQGAKWSNAMSRVRSIYRAKAPTR